MPPQSLNLNEYGIESGGTAPQARNFAFLGHKSAKISFLFTRFLFIRRLVRLSFGIFFWVGANDMLAPLLGFFWGMARLPLPLDPPVLRSK